MSGGPADTRDSAQPTVLVVGATGNQGGAIIDALQTADRDFTIRGLTRTPDSDRAQALASSGVDVRRGNLDDAATLQGPVAGVDAVVTVTNIWTAGFDRAVRQGQNIADVAVEQGVDHLLVTGAGYHDRDLGVRALEPAGEIEAYVRSLDVHATFLRPVWFMHNLEPAFEDILNGTLALPLKRDVTIQMVDVDDLGRATARVLSNPTEFVGEGYDLAGDEHTLTDMARILSEVTCTNVQPFSVPLEDAEAEMGPEMAELFAWFNDEGYDVDIEGLEHDFGFEFTTFREYLRKNEWTDKTQPSRMPGLVKAMMDDGEGTGA